MKKDFAIIEKLKIDDSDLDRSVNTTNVNCHNLMTPHLNAHYFKSKNERSERLIRRNTLALSTFSCGLLAASSYTKII